MIYLIYDFQILRVEFWEVPEGQHIDDIAGKYFSMDNEEQMTAFRTLKEAKAKARELLDQDIEKAIDKLNKISTQKVEKFRGRYPEEDCEY